MENKIVGRKKEIHMFEEVLTSKSAEFLAIYGRRRVGKTYLVKQFFESQSGIFFELTGLNDGNLKEQLANLSISLAKTFYDGAEMAIQKTWTDALRQLSKAIEGVPLNKRIFLFFDELPWLCTRKSGFLKALEYFWNSHWSNRKKLVLIVCGSAASWMLEKIIYAKGGLHNRITVSLSLLPFSLKEVEEYLEYHGHKLNREQALQIYMVTGGIPHYLKAIKKNYSVAQNINALCFQKNGLLFDEFNKLFYSLYEFPELYINIIRAIAKKANGISRDDLIKSIKSSDGGYLNVMLKSLEEAGFISSFLPLGHTRRGVHYRLIDEYVLFYLNWIEPLHKQTRITTTTSYWTKVIHTAAWYAWAGYAFEAVCWKHVDAIKSALGLDAIHVNWGDWRYIPEKSNKGAQIDLILDRDDDCITLCEIKHTEKDFAFTKSYSKDIETKQAIFKEQTRTKKQIQWCLIVSNGVVRNEYFKTLIDHVVVLDDLFK
ncbi:MAG: ATP-binding protein [Gammaproteobacteria bacterium]|nr:ATP-binding protein [Gammaproteobacteria bacterium]MCW5583362.1 ATP-binding protein [Gammaproteobacteria bacterium]